MGTQLSLLIILIILVKLYTFLTVGNLIKPNQKYLLINRIIILLTVFAFVSCAPNNDELNKKKLDSLEKQVEALKKDKDSKKLPETKPEVKIEKQKPINEIPFKSFSKEFLVKASTSKQYFLEHSTDVISISIKKGNQENSGMSDKEIEYKRFKGDFDMLQTTPNDTKTTIGSTSILIERFIAYSRGMNLYFQKDSNGDWKLYSIVYLNPFF